MSGVRIGGDERDVLPLCMKGRGFGNVPGVWLSRPGSLVDDNGGGLGSASLGGATKGLSEGCATMAGLPSVTVALLGVVSTMFKGTAAFRSV